MVHKERETVLSNIVSKYRTSAMDEVLPNLFLGGFGASQNPELLLEKNIKSVVCCLETDLTTNYGQGMTVLRLHIMDSIATNISEHFHQAIAFIHTARCRGGESLSLSETTRLEGVLVHCFAGVSRSATIVAAYLMTVTDLNFLSSLGFMTTRRRVANPNTGFRMQLCKYSKEVNRNERRHFLKELVGPEAFHRLLEADLTVTNTSDIRRNSIPCDST